MSAGTVLQNQQFAQQPAAPRRVRVPSLREQADPRAAQGLLDAGAGVELDPITQARQAAAEAQKRTAQIMASGPPPGSGEMSPPVTPDLARQLATTGATPSQYEAGTSAGRPGVPALAAAGVKGLEMGTPVKSGVPAVQAPLGGVFASPGGSMLAGNYPSLRKMGGVVGDEPSDKLVAQPGGGMAHTQEWRDWNAAQDENRRATEELHQMFPSRDEMLRKAQVGGIMTFGGVADPEEQARLQIANNQAAEQNYQRQQQTLQGLSEANSRNDLAKASLAQTREQEGARLALETRKQTHQEEVDRHDKSIGGMVSRFIQTTGRAPTSAEREDIANALNESRQMTDRGDGTGGPVPGVPSPKIPGVSDIPSGMEGSNPAEVRRGIINAIQPHVITDPKTGLSSPKTGSVPEAISQMSLAAEKLMNGSPESVNEFKKQVVEKFGETAFQNWFRQKVTDNPKETVGRGLKAFQNAAVKHGYKLNATQGTLVDNFKQGMFDPRNRPSWMPEWAPHVGNVVLSPVNAVGSGAKSLIQLLGG